MQVLQKFPPNNAQSSRAEPSRAKSSRELVRRAAIKLDPAQERALRIVVPRLLQSQQSSCPIFARLDRLAAIPNGGSSLRALADSMQERKFVFLDVDGSGGSEASRLRSLAEFTRQVAPRNRGEDEGEEK